MKRIAHRLVNLTPLAALPFLLYSQAPSTSDSQTSPTFMGRKVVINDPGPKDDYDPKGPASVCINGPPHQQCYTAPVTDNSPFGNRPAVSVIQLKKDMPALLFSAATGRVSGWQIHFALLRPGDDKTLEDWFMSAVTVSNQSRHAFWTQVSLSDTAIFLTADYVMGPGEAHYTPHRYIISAYVLKPATELVDLPGYYLEDQYMTAGKYDSDSRQDILTAEKPEILARLKRLKAKRTK